MVLRHEVEMLYFDRLSPISARLGNRGCFIHIQKDGLVSNWARIDSDSEPDSEKDESSSTKGCLPCQTDRIARLSFRGFRSTARKKRPL